MTVSNRKQTVYLLNSAYSWLFWFCLSSFCSLLTGDQRRCYHQPPTPPTAYTDCPSALRFTSATLSLSLSPCPSPLAPGFRDPRCLLLTSMSYQGGRRFAVRHVITLAGWSWWVSSLFPQLETFYLMMLLTVISQLGHGSFYSLLQPIIPDQGNDVVHCTYRRVSWCRAFSWFFCVLLKYMHVDSYAQCHKITRLTREVASFKRGFNSTIQTTT